MFNDQLFVNNNWSLTQNTITRTRTWKFCFDCQKFFIRQFMYDTIWIYIDIIDLLFLKFDDCRECSFCCNTFIFLCIFVRFHNMNDFKSIFKKKNVIFDNILIFFSEKNNVFDQLFHSIWRYKTCHFEFKNFRFVWKTF